jgi:hypothetical protein
MVLLESIKSSHTPVEILLLHEIFRYSRRIPQARKKSTTWRDDAAGAELDVAGKTP